MEYYRSFNVTWELADDRAVILDAHGSTLTTLNPIGTLIWRFLDQPRRVADVAELLAAEFPTTDRSQLEVDTAEFLAELHGDGLVVTAPTAP